MTKVTREEVEHIAHLARLQISLKKLKKWLIHLKVS